MLLNESNILKSLKAKGYASIIGFSDETMTQVILSDNCFILMVNINEFKPDGRLMGLIDKAKATILLENSISYMYNVQSQKVSEITVKSVTEIFNSMASLPIEASEPVPFSVTVYDGGDTFDETLIKTHDHEYVAFDTRLIDLMKSRVLLKDGHLVKKTNKWARGERRTYALVVDNDVYRFLCLPLRTPHRAVLPYLQK